MYVRFIYVFYVRSKSKAYVEGYHPKNALDGTVAPFLGKWRAIKIFHWELSHESIKSLKSGDLIDSCGIGVTLVHNQPSSMNPIPFI